MVVINIADKDGVPMETRCVQGARIAWDTKEVYWTYNGSSFDYCRFTDCSINVEQMPVVIQITKE